jgi:hypothetical protein
MACVHIPCGSSGGGLQPVARRYRLQVRASPRGFESYSGLQLAVVSSDFSFAFYVHQAAASA